MKTGDKFPTVIELIRPLDHDELWPDEHGVPVTISNLSCNKWIARVAGTQGPSLLMCLDGYDEQGPRDEMRRALVKIIELGSKFKPL